MAKLRVDKIAASGQITENTGSVFFDGSSDWLRARGGDNFNDFNFGSSDFTIEGFFYANDVNGTDIPIALAADTVSANSDAGWYIRYQSNKIEGKAYSGGSEIGATQSGTVSNNTWYHVAYVREGSTFTLYVDGVAVSTATSSSSLNWNSGWKVEIGSGYGGANYFAGYISNLRICKGHAVYKSNFAPPTRELEVHQGPDDDRTVLLACYDGENIFADKSGRHILASQGNRTSSPTLAAGETPVGITTFNPGLTRSVDPTAGPTFQGGAGFVSQNWLTLPKGTTTERFPDFGAVDAASARGLFGGGRTPTYLNTIDYITISTLGNAQDFGDLTQARGYMASSSSRTRGVFNGGGTPGAVNTQDFITISSTGDAQNFGELQTARYGAGNCSSSIRGVFGGGNPGPSNVIEFITIATAGNTQDFGDLTQARVYVGGCSSSTRGIFGGGTTPSDKVDTMDFIAISSTGNATDFGNLTQARTGVSGLSSRTRGVFSGGLSGNDPYTYHDIIDYITIASLGNATDFGDLIAGAYYTAGCSSSIRGVLGGALITPAYQNTIQYITITSTGDAQDFGDLTATRGVASAVSNGHGGLG